MELGRLFVLPLPAGAYRLVREPLRVSMIAWVGAEPLVVRVAAGGIRYIGNPDVADCIGPVNPHRWNIRAGLPAVPDKGARGIPLLPARFAALQSREIRAAVVDDAARRGRDCRPGTALP